MIKLMDMVRLLHTKNVEFLSGPEGNPANPDGLWTVIGFKNGKLILSKYETIIVTTQASVRKMAAYNINATLDKLNMIKNKHNTKD